MRTGQFWLAVACVMIVAVFFRFFKLGQVPVGLYWDETAILVDAKALVATGYDMHGHSALQAIFPSYGDYKLPVYIWLASGAVQLFGASAWAVRLPSALAGLATVVVGGMTAWEVFSGLSKREKRGVFVATALVIGVAPWSILFSRTGFEGHVGQLFLALSLWCVLKARQKPIWLVGAVALGVVATYTYFSIRFVWPVVFLAATLFFGQHKQRDWWRGFLIKTAVPLVAYALLLLPMYRSTFFAASNQFRLSTVSVFTMADWPVVSNQYKLLAGNTLFDKFVYYPKIVMLREFFRNLSDNTSFDFLFLSGDPNLRHGTGQHGVFLWIFALPFLFGWWSLWSKHRAPAIFLLIWWLAALVPASVPEETPHALRSLNALVPLSIVIGWGSWRLWQALWRKRKVGWWKAGVTGVALVVTALTVVEFGLYYFTVYPQRSASAWQDGYTDVALEACRLSQEVDRVWIRSFDSRFFLWLLAYCVPAENLQAIEYTQYMPSQIGNIIFHTIEPAAILNSSESQALVGQKKELQALFPPEQFTWTSHFYTADGQTEYAAIVLKQP